MAGAKVFGKTFPMLQLPSRLVLIGVTIALTAGCSTATSGGDASGCNVFRFSGTVYEGTGVRAEAVAGADYDGETLPLRLGAPLGEAVNECGFTLEEPGGVIPVHRLKGVDPAIAVGSPLFEGVLVRTGLCRGYVRTMPCLRDARRDIANPS